MWPSRESVEKTIPSQSFIHSSDFDNNGKLLANYLNYVGSSFNEYKKYFTWRKHYTPVYKGSDLEKLRICELCYRMNTLKNVRYYNSVSNFFEKDCNKIFNPNNRR